MSTMRKPGCFACKTKRVKCDKSLPSCHRCLKLGKKCPGYQVESDLLFRDMSKYAEKKVQKRVRDRLGGNMGSNTYHSEAVVQNITPTFLSPGNAQFSTPLGGLPPQVGTNWMEIAIPRFFADYVYRSENVRQFNISFIIEIANANKSCACIQEALRAVALISLANQTHQKRLETEASQYFYRAVGLLAKSLQDPEEAKKDTTLASTFLFGWYTLISGYDISPRWSHFNREGQVALLRLRGDFQLLEPTGHSIWGILNTIHMSKYVTSHIYPPQETERWLEITKEKHPTYDLTVLILQTACRCADAQLLFDATTRNEWWVIGLLKIVKEAIRIDEGIQDYEDLTSGAWRYKEIRTIAEPNQNRYQIFSDVIVGAFWNRNRSLRIHLHEVLLRCITLIQSHPYGQTLSFDFEGTRNQSVAFIKEMVSHICAAMPFCLGIIDSTGKVPKDSRPSPIGGYFSVLPLYIAMVSAEDGSENQAWIQGKLDFISNAMGIRLATLLAHREKKDPWDIR